MVRDKEIFLMDSNSFVTPYRQYYAFDLIPAYWAKLSKCFGSNRIVLLDIVKAEINKGHDALTDWLNNETEMVICNHVSPEIIEKYQEVLQYVQNCGFYKEQALAAWAPAEIADPWLIAAAAVNNYTIITSEVPSGGLSKKTPNRNAKIPDVAHAFGVKTNNLFYMMRELALCI